MLLPAPRRQTPATSRQLVHLPGPPLLHPLEERRSVQRHTVKVIVSVSDTCRGLPEPEQLIRTGQLIQAIALCPPPHPRPAMLRCGIHFYGVHAVSYVQGSAVSGRRGRGNPPTSSSGNAKARSAQMTGPRQVSGSSRSGAKVNCTASCSA